MVYLLRKTNCQTLKHEAIFKPNLKFVKLIHGTCLLFKEPKPQSYQHLSYLACSSHILPTLAQLPVGTACRAFLVGRSLISGK